MTTIIYVPMWDVVAAIGAYIIGAAWMVSLQIEVLILEHKIKEQINAQVALRRERRAGRSQ